MTSGQKSHKFNFGGAGRAEIFGHKMGRSTLNNKEMAKTPIKIGQTKQKWRPGQNYICLLGGEGVTQVFSEKLPRFVDVAIRYFL